LRHLAEEPVGSAGIPVRTCFLRFPCSRRLFRRSA